MEKVSVKNDGLFKGTAPGVFAGGADLFVGAVGIKPDRKEWVHWR
jgi:hypothetical protein